MNFAIILLLIVLSSNVYGKMTDENYRDMALYLISKAEPKSEEDKREVLQAYRSINKKNIADVVATEIINTFGEMDLPPRYPMMDDVAVKKETQQILTAERTAAGVSGFGEFIKAQDITVKLKDEKEVAATAGVAAGAGPGVAASAAAPAR